MRVWRYDRIGGLASENFDINAEGKKFVKVMLGFLSFSESELGFDPTIEKKGDVCFIKIKREDQETEETIILEKPIRQTASIVGRSTSCWAAHLKEDPAKRFIVKDTWQLPESVDEGELLKKARNSGIENIAKYYHHYRVQVDGKFDDVLKNIRSGFKPKWSGAISKRVVFTKNDEHDTKVAGHKRKRGSIPRRPAISIRAFQTNRIHHRMIISTIGKPLHKIESLENLLKALKCCIECHESLVKIHIWHRDITIYNLLCADDEEYKGFLIDLDAAMEIDPENPSKATGAAEATTARAFMAIKSLRGTKYRYTPSHDLESFFWVLLWLCLHYNDDGAKIANDEYDQWNYASDRILRKLKVGTIYNEEMFLEEMREVFTTKFKPLVRVVNELRKVLFPVGVEREEDVSVLYEQMYDVLDRGPELIKEEKITENLTSDSVSESRKRRRKDKGKGIPISVEE